MSALCSFHGLETPPKATELSAQRHQTATMAQQPSPSPAADWSLSPSRSPRRAKSEQPPLPNRADPVWMQKTAQRLEAAASTAQRAAAEGGAELKALYVMSSAEIVQAASSQPRHTPISESWEYKERASSQPRSHVEASYVLNRLTGGGYKKPEMSSGPFATALNPNRHTMMIQGRPVVVPCGRKHKRISFQTLASDIYIWKEGNQSLLAFR